MPGRERDDEDRVPPMIVHTQRESPAQRPGRDFETGPVTTWIRRAALILTALTGVALLVRYPFMPDTIPTHFGLSGEADAWGPKASVFLLIGICTALAAGLAWLSKRPQIFNYPMVVTEQNAQTVYREGERTVVWLTGSLALIYAAIALGVALDVSAGWIFAVSFAAFIGSLIAGLARMLKTA